MPSAAQFPSRCYNSVLSGEVAVKASAVQRESAKTPHGFEPARVGYHKIVADILRRAPAQDAVRIAWQLVAGTTVSERTSVAGFAEESLKVRVPDLAWRNELIDFAPQYLSALNKLLPFSVSRIEFLTDEKKTPTRA